MLITPEMSLVVWNEGTDTYQHEELAENWAKLDEHDHTSGKGKQITTGAIADAAVTVDKLAPGTIADYSLGDEDVTTAKLADDAVTTSKIASTAVTAPKISVPSFSAYRNAALSLATGAVVVFDFEEWDTEGWFNTTTGRFTPLLAGKYRLNARVTRSTDSSIGWTVILRKNGSDYKVLSWSLGVSGTLVPQGGGTAIASANGTTDYFDIVLVHTSGGSDSIINNSLYTFFQGEFISS